MSIIKYQTGELGTYTGYTEATNTGGRAIRFEKNGVDIDNLPILAVPRRDMDKLGQPPSGKPQPGDILILKSESTGKFTVAVAADTGGLSEADGDLGRQTAANLGLNLTKSGSSITYAEGEHKGDSVVKNDIKHAVIVSTGTTNFPELYDKKHQGAYLDESNVLRRFTSEDSIAFAKSLNERIKTEGLTEEQAATEISRFYDNFRKSEKGTHAYEALAKVTGKDFQSMELAYLPSTTNEPATPATPNKSVITSAKDFIASLAAPVIGNAIGQVAQSFVSGQVEEFTQREEIFRQGNLSSAEYAQFAKSYEKLKDFVEQGGSIAYGKKGEEAKAMQDLINAGMKSQDKDAKLLTRDGDFRTKSVGGLTGLLTDIGAKQDGNFDKADFEKMTANLPPALKLAIGQAAEPAAQLMAATAPAAPAAGVTATVTAGQSSASVNAASPAPSSGKTLYVGDSNSLMAGEVAGAERYSQVAAIASKAPKLSFDKDGGLITSPTKPSGLSRFERAVPSTDLNVKDLGRVVIFAGTNDAGYGSNPAQTGKNVADYVEGIAKEAKANPSISMVVVLPQPELPGKDSKVLAEERKAITEKVEELKQQGVKIGVVDPVGAEKKGLHYTTAGYEEINAKVDKVAQNLDAQQAQVQQVAASPTPQVPKDPNQLLASNTTAIAR